MELQGTIIVLGETQTFGANGFRKREFVIKTEGDYPQTIQLEAIQDKTDLLNEYQVGQSVTCSININGREWTNPQGETKYFNSIQAWRIVKGEAIAPEPQPTAAANDDLPF